MTRSQVFAKYGGTTDTVGVLIRTLMKPVKMSQPHANIAQAMWLTWKTGGSGTIISSEVFIAQAQALAKFTNN